MINKFKSTPNFEICMFFIVILAYTSDKQPNAYGESVSTGKIMVQKINAFQREILQNFYKSVLGQNQGKTAFSYVENFINLNYSNGDDLSYLWNKS